MAIDLSKVPMNSRRAIEAELAGQLYVAALPSLGRERALGILNDAIDDAAREAGRAFAATAPGKIPSLEHFSGVVEMWRAGGALDIADVSRTVDCFSFRVTSCGYMRMYAEMGLPHDLFATLSCQRDAAFAAGYSGHLVMNRPQTISGGAPVCVFRFGWR